MSENFLKIAEGINILPLKMALIRQPELFGKNAQRATTYQSPHENMTDIWVRYNDLKNYGEGFNDEHDSVWYPDAALIPQIRPIVLWLMTYVEGERLGGILITKLPAGGKIAPHTDAGWHAEYYDKYYIPIQNEDGAIFGFQDGIIKPKIGDVYWFKNSNLHWVENNSSVDRIALIICIKSQRGTLCLGQQ